MLILVVQTHHYQPSCLLNWQLLQMVECKNAQYRCMWWVFTIKLLVTPKYFLFVCHLFAYRYSLIWTVILKKRRKGMTFPRNFQFYQCWWLWTSKIPWIYQWIDKAQVFFLKINKGNGNPPRTTWPFFRKKIPIKTKSVWF